MDNNRNCRICMKRIVGKKRKKVQCDEYLEKYTNVRFKDDARGAPGYVCSKCLRVSHNFVQSKCLSANSVYIELTKRGATCCQKYVWSQFI